MPDDDVSGGGDDGDEGQDPPDDDKKPDGDDKAGKGDEDTKAKRRAVLDRLALEGQKAAQTSSQQAPDTSKRFDTDDLEVDTEGLDKEQVKAIKTALNKAKEVSGHVGQLADFAIQQTRKVAAFEIAQEFDITDADDIADFEKALASANTPNEVGIRKQEILMELRKDGSFARQATPSKKAPAKRQFDEGRGSTGNERQALLDEIDALDPLDPEFEKKSNALKRRVDVVQERHTKAAGRR